MQEEFDLHELAIEDARHGHQRPKIEEYGHTLFVVMRLPEQRDDELAFGEVAIFAGPNFVLSVRRDSHEGFLGVRQRCESEPEHLRQGAGFVLYALMDAVVDRYLPALDALEVELERLEGQIFQRGAARASIEHLYALKQRATATRHAVAPLLEVVGKLHGGRVPAVCAHSQEFFRDVHDHLARIQLGLGGVRETIGTAMQVHPSMVTIEESEVTSAASRLPSPPCHDAFGCARGCTVRCVGARSGSPAGTVQRESGR
jgi:magnesium transporter